MPMHHHRAHALPLPQPGAFLGASVIPFAVSDDRLWVLLGQESKTGKWCPFGGRAEPGETPAQTGLRELCEESLGVLGRIELLAERGRGWWQRPLHVADKTGFVTFALPMPFNNEQRKLDPYRFGTERKRVTDMLREDSGGCPFLDKQAVFWADAEQVDSFDLRAPFAQDWRRVLLELRRRTANWRRPGGVRRRVQLPSPERPQARPAEAEATPLKAGAADETAHVPMQRGRKRRRSPSNDRRDTRRRRSGSRGRRRSRWPSRSRSRG